MPARFDKTFLEAAAQDAMVSAMLLVANPARGGDPIIKTLGYLDAVHEGTYAMPNVTDSEGLTLFGASST